MITNWSLWKLVHLDYMAQSQGRQGLKNFFAVIFFGRGFQTLLSHRLQILALRLPIVGKFLAKILHYITCCLTSCDISIYAELSGGIYIPHPTGIVIGDKVIIDHGTVILQQVTVGKKTMGGTDYPSIGKHVFLGAGCKILGELTVGDYSVIGANSVVLQDVPKHGKAVGVPARIVEGDHPLTNPKPKHN